MKILIVCRLHGEHIAAFISEQADSLRQLGNEVRFVMADRGGGQGYWNMLSDIKKNISEWHPDVIHAHYGISGLIANLQRQVPVIVTYPGSDINELNKRPISIMSMWLSRYNLVVSKRQLQLVKRFVNLSKIQILRYGVMLDVFYIQNKEEARRRMGFEKDVKYVLFSSKFTRLGKDPDLAKSVVEVVNKRRCKDGRTNVQLIPLNGEYTKEEMVTLMNAIDAAIVTSKKEGSPQFTKEVMACGCPIVSVDVGDVAEQLEGVTGCGISKTRNADELADLLEQALEFQGRTNGREKLISENLSLEQTGKQLMKIYQRVIE